MLGWLERMSGSSPIRIQGSASAGCPTFLKEALGANAWVYFFFLTFVLIFYKFLLVHIQLLENTLHVAARIDCNIFWVFDCMKHE